MMFINKDTFFDTSSIITFSFFLFLFKYIFLSATKCKKKKKTMTLKKLRKNDLTKKFFF